MYIAVGRYKTDPTLVPEALKKIEEAFMPVLQMSPGFLAYYAFQDGAGSFASISVFQDQAAAEASTQSAANLVKMSLASLLPNPPEVFHGPVSCHSYAAAR